MLSDSLRSPQIAALATRLYAVNKSRYSVIDESIDYLQYRREELAGD